MKTTKILKWLPMLAAIFGLCIATVGCTDGDNGGNSPTTMKLTGTKWKLVKLTNTKTGVEKPIYVGDDICTKFVPTMDFETNTTGMLQIASKPLIPIDLTDSMRWFQHFTQEGGYDNIGLYMIGFPKRSLANIVSNSHPVGYKVEDNLLKFYYYDDGFFYFDTNCVITQMLTCGGPFSTDENELLTDSNWYNCAVFEEVK